MVRCAIGIDVGGTTIKAARVDGAGDSDDLRRIPTPPSADRVAESCAELALALLTDEVVGAGIGSAGFVNGGVHIWGPHVPGPTPLVEAVTKAIGRPATADNDANAAAFAELRLGAARGRSNAVVVMLGTGIGGGLIIDGSIYRGRGFAGELGHMVVDPDGPECECGRNGCWETLVSGSVLDAGARGIAAADPSGAVATTVGDEKPSGVHLMVAAQDGDTASLEVWSAVGRWLGRGMADLVAVLDPELFVVGGGPSRAGDLLLAPATEALTALMHAGRIRAVPPVVISRYGQNAAVIGAALQALEKFDD
ncbi:MAG: ROK family protein [Acidimicrobiia bacterium]